MNREQAEAQITRLVTQVDAIRESKVLSEDERSRLLDNIGTELIKMKEITGPRFIIGTSKM